MGAITADKNYTEVANTANVMYNNGSEKANADVYVRDLHVRRNQAAMDVARNTGKPVYFDPEADYSVSIPRYSEEVNRGISAACREVAQLGSADGKEHDALIDATTGEIVFKEIGERDMTGTGFWDYIYTHRGKYVFVHNHNSDGWISSPDLEVLLTTENIDTLIAMRSDGVQYVAPKTGSIDTLLAFIYGDNISETELVKRCLADYVKEYFEKDGRK